MIRTSVSCCARRSLRFWTTCLALGVCHGFAYSPSRATSIDFDSVFGSSSSMSIRVVKSEGPISVTYDYTGTASNDLPTIEIHEELHQPTMGGAERKLWSDVEVEVCLNADSDGSVIDGINGAIDHINDIIDDIFGFLNKSSRNTSASSTSTPPDNGNDWEDGVDIGIDKFVKNKAGVLLSNYSLVLGTGAGMDFARSTPADDLYFLSSPMPKEVTDYFENPPAAGHPDSDYLQWNSNGTSAPGLNNYQESTFWFGVHVPQELFVEDPQHQDQWKAMFTIRQHTNVPEPTSVCLLWAGLLATGFAYRSACRRSPSISCWSRIPPAVVIAATPPVDGACGS